MNFFPFLSRVLYSVWSIFSVVWRPLVFCVLLGASFPYLICSLRKLGATSENEEIETATSLPGSETAQGQVLQGHLRPGKSNLHTSHSILPGSQSGVTPLKQVISYIFLIEEVPSVEEREQYPSAYIEVDTECSVPVVSRSNHIWMC